MKRLLLSLSALALLAVTPVIAADIEVIGSRTMYLLNNSLAARFHQTHPAVNFHISDAGTGKGIDALIAGKTDIAAVTRLLRPPEMKLFIARYHREPVMVPVALEGISVFLHPHNGVDTLTVDQLARILSGEIRNWKEVGGANLPIHVYSFDNTTGRYWYVVENLLGKRSFAAETHYAQAGSASSDAERLAAQEKDMIQFVSHDVSAIGYGDLKKVRLVKLARIVAADGKSYWPTPQDVQSGAYPLSRRLMYLLHDEPRGELLDFVRWCPGQEELIRSADFVPLRR